VRLQGPTGNATALGAQMRLVSGKQAFPLRELHGGSGYWSQDGAAQVLAIPKGPATLSVRWPGGRQTTTPVPEGAREIVVTHDGAPKAEATAAR
jgi:hypothetical protein